MVCHHPDKSCDRQHCDNGDMFSICHVTFRKHLFKLLCEFRGGSFLRPVTSFPCLVATGQVQVEI